MGVSDAVANGEQRLAPVDVVLASLDVYVHIANVETGEDERVEEFSRRACDVAVRIGVVVIVGVVAAASQRVVRLRIPLIDIVIPARRTDAEAVLFLPNNVELCKQVQATGYHVATVELVLGVVEEGRTIEMVVLPFHAPAGVVADGVVPADFEVRVAGLEGYCLYAGGTRRT
ncbi:hypothetical protein D3C80_1230840 [compost metagenome]